MLKLFVVALLGLSCLAFTGGEYVKDAYKGFQVWRIHNPTTGTHKLIENLSLDVWGSSTDWMDVMVASTDLNFVQRELLRSEETFEVVIHDVGRLIEETLPSSHRDSLPGDPFNFQIYHSYDEIMTYLDNVTEISDFVSQKKVGQTLEGREIRMMTLSVPNPDPFAVKPAVWIDCGIHAREWITEASCLWMLDHLVSNYGLDSQVSSFLENFDIYMVPILNADGYDYSWKSDRMWRKNRNPNEGSSSNCPGVDLNRNFDDGHWGEKGSSDIACSDLYHGIAPFSELETLAVRDTLSSIKDDQEVVAYFSVHSYSQLWLFPFGWTADLPQEYDELMRVTTIGVEAVRKVHGTIYTNGPHYATIYPASGTNVDWGYSIGIVNSYVIELRDTGEVGFLLPPSQIVPTAQEIMAGILAAVPAIYFPPI